MAREQESQTSLFRWQWNKKILGFALVFFPLTLTLGFWQLQRADEKGAILTAQEQRINSAPVEFSGVATADQNQFRNVIARGGIDSQRIFLVDNLVRRGRPGYEVLSPLKVNVEGEDQWLLVNRGWLPGGQDRSVLPTVPPFLAKETSVEISGYLYRSPGKRVVLKDEIWPSNTWPLVIQAIDMVKISRHLGHAVYPYTLRLVEQAGDIGQEPTLEIGWEVINMAPEKHIGYAVQWFLMALALLVLTIFANSNLTEVMGRKRRA
ncbi:MAG: SURF1 family protein [Porticoccaceae bacterium]|nr:SURF1 family protein [Porticoccaceae bacterium]